LSRSGIESISVGAAQPCGQAGRSAGPIEDFLGSAQVFALALVNVLEARILREVAGTQLTSPQMKVLKLVAQARVKSIGDIAKVLGVSDPAASKTVDRLVRRKLVRRTESEADRRANQLALTASGSRIIAEYEAARNRRLAQIFREVPPEDLEKTAALLDRVAASIVTHAQNPEEVCLQCGVYLKERCLIQDVASRACSYRTRADRKE
jgi:DNA-binding MarR family transcriptional regulator